MWYITLSSESACKNRAARLNYRMFMGKRLPLHLLITTAPSFKHTLSFGHQLQPHPFEFHHSRSYLHHISNISFIQKFHSLYFFISKQTNNVSFALLAVSLDTSKGNIADIFHSHMLPFLLKVGFVLCSFRQVFTRLKREWWENKSPENEGKKKQRTE